LSRDGTAISQLKSLEKDGTEQRNQDQRDWHRLTLKKTTRKRVLY
jgi:hypothetical protein